MSFLLNYLKEAKFETLTLQVGPSLVSFLESLKLGLGDIHKLKEDQLAEFTHIFKQLEGDAFLREVKHNSEFYGLNSEVLDLVLDAVVQILARKNSNGSQLQ